MMTWQETFRKMAQSFINAQEVREGDVIKGDILYCGKCKEPRREFIAVQGERFIVTRMCACDRAKAEAEKAEEERRKAEIEQEERVRKSGIGARYKDAYISNFNAGKKNSGVYNLICNYVEDFEEMKARNQGLLFWGDVGTGKTYAAMVIANELLTRGVSVLVTSFAEIMSRARGYETEDEVEFMRRIKTVPLVVLDDLGAERDSDYALEKLYSVIDARYKSGKPTVYTTNLALQDMRDCTDIRFKRLYDRIFESCFPVKFEGESERIKEARNRYKSMADLMKERK